MRRLSVLPLFLVGLALRPQIVGIGPLLPRIESSLGISHAVAGLLATIPVFCMGLFAPLAPPFLRRYGSRVAIGGSLVVVGVAGLVRAAVPGAALVLLLTIPIGVGIAVGGTLLPVVVKEEHADRPTLGTGVYTAGINVGATIASLIAVPLALLGGWRGALAVFSAATIAVVFPWLYRRDATPHPPERARLPFRVPVAWAIAGAFALQSILFYGFNAWLADAYVERGWSQTASGGLLALMNGVALAVGIWTAFVGDKYGSRRAYLVSSSAVAAGGAALLAANAPGAWAWAAIVGGAMGVLFTSVMTLPLDAAAGRAEVAALSTLMLGVGYLISSLAPTVLGAVRDWTGTFTVPFALLVADAVLLLVLTATLTTARLVQTRSMPA